MYQSLKFLRFNLVLLATGLMNSIGTSQEVDDTVGASLLRGRLAIGASALTPHVVAADLNETTSQSQGEALSSDTHSAELTSAQLRPTLGAGAQTPIQPQRRVGPFRRFIKERLSADGRRGGKLKLLRGLSTIEGSGGGAIASWATISGNETERGIGASTYYTFVPLDDFDFRGVWGRHRVL